LFRSQYQVGMQDKSPNADIDHDNTAHDHKHISPLPEFCLTARTPIPPGKAIVFYPIPEDAGIVVPRLSKGAWFVDITRNTSPPPVIKHFEIQYA